MHENSVGQLARLAVAMMSVWTLACAAEGTTELTPPTGTDTSDASKADGGTGLDVTLDVQVAPDVSKDDLGSKPDVPAVPDVPVVPDVAPDVVAPLDAPELPPTPDLGPDSAPELPPIDAGCVTPSDCDDQNPCTDNVCSVGSCSNPAIVCPDDGDVCTDAVCVAPGGCTQVTNPASCDDGTACTTNDT